MCTCTRRYRSIELWIALDLLVHQRRIPTQCASYPWIEFTHHTYSLKQHMRKNVVHSPQLTSRLPAHVCECVRKCCLILKSSANIFPQLGYKHGYLRSPVCVRKWRFSFDDSTNARPHPSYWHTNWARKNETGEGGRGQTKNT